MTREAGEKEISLRQNRFSCGRRNFCLALAVCFHVGTKRNLSKNVTLRTATMLSKRYCPIVSSKKKRGNFFEAVDKAPNWNQLTCESTPRCVSLCPVSFDFSLSLSSSRQRLTVLQSATVEE